MFDHCTECGQPFYIGFDGLTFHVDPRQDAAHYPWSEVLEVSA